MAYLPSPAVMDLGMYPFLEAAQAVSEALSELGIKHAFIGGFAVNLLGGSRCTLDIDVEVDTTDAVAVRKRLQESNSRFAMQNNKLVWMPLEHTRGDQIPIELLRTCDLGLPQTLDVIYRTGIIDIAEDPRTPRPGPPLPILNPALLILTKIKCCVMYIGSTRPASARKFQADLEDIHWILSLLHVEGQFIDFAGYHCTDIAAKDRLYLAVAKLLIYYTRHHGDVYIDMFDSVLDNEDFERVMAVNMTEVGMTLTDW